MHTLVKLVFCVGLSMFAAVLIWATAAPPVKAQEQQCRFTLADTVVGLMAQNVRHGLLTPNGRDHFIAGLESSLGIQFPDVTNVLVAELEAGIFYGLEIGGCLMPPQPLFLRTPPRRSGATPAGVFA